MLAQRPGKALTAEAFSVATRHTRSDTALQVNHPGFRFFVSSFFMDFFLREPPAAQPVTQADVEDGGRVSERAATAVEL